jgi:hypothetical protein
MEALPPPELLGISIKEIAKLCQVSVRTARRWKQGTMCPPETALMVLRGDLGLFDPEWRGWTLRHGCLISPEGWEMRASDVLASRLHEAQLSAWRIENRRLQFELERALSMHLDDQPTPDSWDVQIIVA